MARMRHAPFLPRHMRLACIALVSVLSACATPPAHTPTTMPQPAGPMPVPVPPSVVEMPVEQRFSEWVAKFRASAQAQGFDEATLRAAFDGVQYQPRVVELDRAQPEFTRTVWEYLDITVSPQRVQRGQEKLAELRIVVDQAAARYGVAPGVL